jgi:hypothetical protein
LAVLEEVGCIAPSGGMTADMQLELWDDSGLLFPNCS